MDAFLKFLPSAIMNNSMCNICLLMCYPFLLFLSVFLLLIKGKHSWMTFFVHVWSQSTETGTGLWWRNDAAIGRIHTSITPSSVQSVNMLIKLGGYKFYIPESALLGIPVHVFVHAVIQAANCVVAKQGKISCTCRWRALVNVHVIHQNGEKVWSQWLCECVIVGDARQTGLCMSETDDLWGISHSTVSGGGKTKQKHILFGWKSLALLVRDVKEERPDWFELTKSSTKSPDHRDKQKSISERSRRQSLRWMDYKSRTPHCPVYNVSLCPVASD